MTIRKQIRSHQGCLFYLIALVFVFASIAITAFFVSVDTTSTPVTDCNTGFIATSWTSYNQLGTENCRSDFSMTTTKIAPSVNIRIVAGSVPVLVVDGDGKTYTIADSQEFLLKPGQTFTARLAP
jgi:hypothetical protein